MAFCTFADPTVGAVLVGAWLFVHLVILLEEMERGLGGGERMMNKASVRVCVVRVGGGGWCRWW